MLNVQPSTHFKTPQNLQAPSSDHSCGYSSLESSSSTSPLSRPLPLRLPKAKYQKLFAGRSHEPQKRLTANNKHIRILQTQINKKIQGSYFFTPGKQEDDHFQKVFIDFFRGLRGGETLVNSAGESLARGFVTYDDVCNIYTTEPIKDDDNGSWDFSTIYSPTDQLIEELSQILEEEYGLKGQFLKSLSKSGQKIGNAFQLETRDTCLREFPIFPRVFPRCIDTLKGIFSSLLIEEWLKQDIEEIKIYLNEIDYIDRRVPGCEELNNAITLWTTAKHYAQQQQQRDIALKTKHKNELKDDLCGTAISGGLSFVTGNPSFVIGKAAQTIMNSLGNKIDPEGRDKRIQVLKIFGGVGLGSTLGGNTWDLGTALGVDLLDLVTKSEKTEKSESALRNLSGSVLKGVLTKDKKKLICQILSCSVAEAVNQLPETDEKTSLEMRIARALLTNSDMQSHYINQYVDKKFKKAPKQTLSDETAAKDPNISKPSQEIEMHDQALYLRLVEEQKQNNLALKKVTEKLNNPHYSEFGSAANTLIEKEAGVKEAQKKYDKKLAIERKVFGPRKEIKAEKKTKSANKNLKKASGEKAVVDQFISNTSNEISKLQKKISSNIQAQAEASAPKHIIPPTPELKAPFAKSSKKTKNHHVAYFDMQGQKQSLGKYKTAGDANLISGAWSHFEVISKNLEMRCYAAQEQLVSQGTHVDNIPERPKLEKPQFSGNDASKNHQKIQKTRIQNQKKVEQYLTQLGDLSITPLEKTGLTKGDINRIARDMTPTAKDPKEHGVFYKAWRLPKKGLDKTTNFLKKIGFTGEITVANMDLYKMKALNLSDRYLPKEAPVKAIPIPKYGWEQLQDHHQQVIAKILEKKTVAQKAPSRALNYGKVFGNGVANGVQLPPTDLNHLGRNNELPRVIIPQRQMQVARFSGSMEFALIDAERQSKFVMRAANSVKNVAVNDFTKSVPKGSTKVLRGICTLMLPDMSDIPGAECPKKHLRKFSNNALFKYDKLVHIKDPHSFVAKAGEFVGEVISLGGIGRVARVAEGISILGMASEGGVVGLVMAEVHGTNKISGVAFGFGGGAVAGSIPIAFRALKPMRATSPLQDRALNLSISRNEAGMQLLENRALRCGFVSDKTVENLAGREIAYIKPFEMLYVKKGPKLEWWKAASPKIDHLKRIAKTPKKFYGSLTREFGSQNLSELQIRRVLDYSGFKSFENPKYFPAQYVAEFAKKNAGIVFRKPGTIYKENILIRICSGLRNENPVTAIIEGKQMNGTMRQQTHYVVQTKGNLKRTIDDRWVRADALNKENQALTHIPLSEYQFKGWE